MGAVLAESMTEEKKSHAVEAIGSYDYGDAVRKQQVRGHTLLTRRTSERTQLVGGCRAVVRIAAHGILQVPGRLRHCVNV